MAMAQHKSLKPHHKDIMKVRNLEKEKRDKVRRSGGMKPPEETDGQMLTFFSLLFPEKQFVESELKRRGRLAYTSI